MSTPPGKTTFTLAEAAELLSCHRETLRRAIRNGELRAAKLGRGFRISRFDLESFWIASGGGDLFGNAGSGGTHGESPSPEVRVKEKKRRGRTRDRQEQLSLLGSLETDGKKNSG